MHPRTERLRELMARNSLHATAVAKLLGRKPATVNMWRCQNGTRVIPDNLLQLLEFKLGRK